MIHLYLDRGLCWAICMGNEQIGRWNSGIKCTSHASESSIFLWVKITSVKDKLLIGSLEGDAAALGQRSCLVSAWVLLQLGIPLRLKKSTFFPVSNRPTCLCIKMYETYRFWLIEFKLCAFENGLHIWENIGHDLSKKLLKLTSFLTEPRIPPSAS